MAEAYDRDHRSCKKTCASCNVFFHHSSSLFRAVMGRWSWSVNTGKYKAWMNQSLAGTLLFLPPRLGGSVGLLGLKSGFFVGN